MFVIVFITGSHDSPLNSPLGGPKPKTPRSQIKVTFTKKNLLGARYSKESRFPCDEYTIVSRLATVVNVHGLILVPIAPESRDSPMCSSQERQDSTVY